MKSIKCPSLQRVSIALSLRRSNQLYIPTLCRRYSEVVKKSSNDSRQRLSAVWVPTGGIAESGVEDSHAKLIRAGFLRQAHSGIFHMLPLGRRVQDKLDALIDKHMSTLGASKLSLSSISSEDLWSKSGRLANAGSELFRLQDRKKVKYLLSPTHEEEITNLVSRTVNSYKDLPVRLYQISRKYRDELRPRQGLLRSREFVMKDLYTFDYSPSLALTTYQDVRQAYANLFDELKIPYLVADADSGQIGGDLSHEFHFPTAQGEDHIISCNACDYVANEELAKSAPTITSLSKTFSKKDIPRIWHGISKDTETLVKVWYLSSLPSSTETHPEVNLHAVKSIIPDLDLSIEDPLPLFKGAQIVHLMDSTWPQTSPPPSLLEKSHISEEVHTRDSANQPLNLMRIKDGDSCSRCTNGKLKVEKAIELGHTFHLGTRYSAPMKATIAVPTHLLEDSQVEPDQATGSDASTRVPIEMGCHGIGVSRIIGAVADTLADEKGLNWPRVMAPYEVVLIAGKGLDDAALEVYDQLITGRADERQPLDLVIDDRDRAFPWKMNDADLIGYPVIVIVGRNWKAGRMCEVQCRRLKIRKDVPLVELQSFVQSLLSQL